jgi:cysteinyl-tRNA synthetase
MLRLHNTLGRKTDEFVPRNAAEVTLYTCGPTVYDYPQLGNLRSFVFEDTLRRTLEASGYKVKHVMNITNVGHLVSDDDQGEDKLEKGAKRESKSVWEVATYYTDSFMEAARDLNLLEPNGYHGKEDNYARATDFIDEQIDIVNILLDKGFAYKTEQAIYFDVKKLPDYGILTGQKLIDKEVAARSDVITDENKKYPHDFALWFFTTGRFENHEMKWPSPWGEGFPGWHLECSAIIHATMGDPIDIHTGGVDHIGTHHTNEMAQTEAAFGNKLASFWVHNEFLMVDGQRMGKSLGNFLTLDDIRKKGFDPLALRLLFLQSHYRSQQNFTWEALEAAQKYLNQLRAFADLRFQAREKAEPIRADYFGAIEHSILENMQNDLSSPSALAKLDEAIDKINQTQIRADETESFNGFVGFLANR